MAIPLPGPGGTVASLLDDTDALGTPAIEPGPWGSPAATPAPPPPSRGWRVEDVVVEREEDLVAALGEADLAEDVPGQASSKRRPFRPIEPVRSSDWLVQALLLLSAAALVLLGLQMQYQRIEQSPRATIEMWGRLALHAAGFFVIVAPLALGGVAVAGKAMRYAMPASAYARTCAVVAVPVLIYLTLQLLTIHRMAGGLTVFLLVFAGGPLTYLAIRVLIGTTWSAAVAAVFGVAVFGGVGFLISHAAVNVAAGALFAGLPR